MRCYVFIQTTKLHIFSIYGNFLLFIFYFLKDIRTEEHVFFERHENRRTSFFERHKNRRTCFFEDMRTEEHVLSLNQRTCSSVLLSYPSQAIPMFSCSPVLPLASNPHVLLFFCLIPRKQSPCSSVLLSYPRKQSLLFFCSPVFKNHVLMSNYHAHFSYSN